ncbi:E3 ubiquitin/ISG15 ligase TRIM25-like [Acipenser ruthenus]|uniref:E3 ubiquitin/ISG15 ligase TRIM25-like n=1 Tax=Acipenser ruthenus TaxID=7906 RepID=UPI0027427B41|nr:E3 ubiquitin/ISG15 ligase TRIM25-like [Acipenser ruthenus]
MAEVNILVGKDRFNCSVCQEILKDPVIIPCGHSYCMGCIKNCWDQIDHAGVYSCPQCRETFTPRPVLCRNTMLAEVVEELEKTGLNPPPAQSYAGPGDVPCDFCTGRKFRAVKSCLMCLASYCETHIKPHYEGAAFKRHKLINAIGNLEQKLCAEHQRVLEVFYETDQTCICLMCTDKEHKSHDTVSTETERKGKQQSLCAPPEAGDLPSITVNTDISFGAVRKAVSEIKDHIEDFCKGGLSKITKTVNEIAVYTLGSRSSDRRLKVNEVAVYSMQAPEPRNRAEFIKYSCQLTLDPNTAYRKLCLSEGNRKVECRSETQSYPDHPERFDSWAQVLCREGLSGTRCYWEIEWSGRGANIGVTYKGISREGRGHSCALGRNDKSWSLFCSGSSYTAWHNNNHTIITDPRSPRIGVYLDFNAGILSFYGVSDTMTLLHRFQTTFTEPLYPGLGLYWGYDFPGFRVWSYDSTVTICQLN